MKNISYLCSMKRSAAVKFNKMIVLAALLLPGWLSAQEKILQAYNNPTESSLVWELPSSQKWVVCNNTSAGFNFAYINYSGVGSFMSTTQKINVKDMYVSSDVYFCGSMFDSTTMTTVGVWGYFPLSGMPTPTVTCFLVDSMECLNKVQYYATPWQKHVVMIGSGKNGHDYILGAYYDFDDKSLGGWELTRLRMPNVPAKFFDIEMMAGYFVFSGKVTGVSNSNLFYINKSPLAGGPFYVTSSIVWKEFLGNTGKILLQRGSTDTLFAVYRYSQYLNVCQLNGQTIISTKKITLPEYVISFRPRIVTYASCLDINSDIVHKNLNLLLSGPEELDADYRVYHIPMHRFSTQGTANIHYYDNCEKMFSLGRSKNNTTTAVGRTSSGYWGLFKVNDNSEGNCFPYYEVNIMTETQMTFDHPKPTYTDETIGMREIIMSVTSPSVTVTTICQ